MIKYDFYVKNHSNQINHIKITVQTNKNRKL